MNYNKILADDHNIGILAGFEVNENKYDGFSAKGTGVAADFLTTLGTTDKPDAVGASSSAWGFFLFVVVVRNLQVELLLVRFGNYVSVEKMDDALAVFSVRGRVSHHHDGGSFLMQAR